MRNELTHDVFRAFARVHVLHHAAEGWIFGLEMIEELRRHGYRLSPGTLYPLLHGLEQAGCLRASKKVVNGRLRKYYRATPAGRRLLARLRARLRELAEEVLQRRTRPSRASSRARTRS